VTDDVPAFVRFAAGLALTHHERTTHGRVVILVDDGFATGSTMRAAVLAVKGLRPARVVVAVPVGAPETCEALRAIADEVVCPLAPDPFSAVGLWYVDFSQTTDDEVRQLLSTVGAAIGRTRSA
jgi:putative phosphoribosyl transferase